MASRRGEGGEYEFDNIYEPISAQYPGLAPSIYVTTDGDTLTGVAQAVFGDTGLWYRRPVASHHS